MWWNVNKRLPLVLKYDGPLQKNVLDMFFVSETCLGHSSYPVFKDFTVISDPKVTKCQHGGFAWYVKDSLCSHVIGVTYGSSFIAFSLDIFPQIVFIGVYIKPETSTYFEPSMFAELCAYVIECHERNKTVFIGGDCNSRPGDLNGILPGSTWKYDKNVDKNLNSHGKFYFQDLCTTANVMPLNHLRYKKLKFDGDFTYQKANKKSQIDYVLTDSEGRKLVSKFSIIQNDWFISDHKPVTVVLSLDSVTPASMLYKRAVELNFDITKPVVKVSRFKGTYDYDKVKEKLVAGRIEIITTINDLVEKQDIESALHYLDGQLQIAHKAPECKQKMKKPDLSLHSMSKVNDSFHDFRKVMGDPTSTGDECDAALNRYLHERSCVHFEVLKKESDAWSSVIAENDSSSLWAKIDWKGNYSRKQPTQHPSVDEFQCFFEDLYSSTDKDECAKINELKSNVTIPLLDDPISEQETEEALNCMKNGGFDYNLPILVILFSCFSQTLLLLLNFIFLVKYPIHLAVSLLSIIPKKGNLLLPKNYRGIQMLRAIGSLYDRIIAKRLYRWMSIVAEQSAFQKGKSAIIQIFIVRLLIEIVKKKGITLYVASVDLEKAFDKVSRYRLLCKLVGRGIGHVMLEALKNIYLHTTCTIHFYGCFSESFTTSRGIRQGSASSVLLFILFMDGLFPFLSEKCSTEQLIKDFHALVHADDTLIISTDRDKFITKCNHMLEYFAENSLVLNFDKSSYFIINPKKTDRKVRLQLSQGYLKYKSIQEYLGVIITDGGVLKHDVSKFIRDKRSNILIKFINFVNKNFLAPLGVKLAVLDTCLASSLLYASETWADNGKEVEVIFRNGLRAALGVRTNINNEILYIESGRYPLKCRIAKQQLKFWLSLKDYVIEHPDSALTHLLGIANEMNLPYTRWYKDLEAEYGHPAACKRGIESSFRTKWRADIENSAHDIDSRLGTYIRVNPTLSTPNYITMFETDRLMVTRFRTGSHSLLVEKGRYTKTPREDRICSCGTGVQTLLHCFSTCPTTAPLLTKRYASLEEVFDDDDVCLLLHKVCKVLKVAV